MSGSKSIPGGPLFWVLQIIFGVLIARTPFLYSEVILHPSENYLPFLALFFAYVVTLWSWIDFSQIMIYTKYERYKKIDMARFVVDLVVVLAYTFLFLSIQNIEINYSTDISFYLMWFPIIFIGYLLSGILRIIKYGRTASRAYVILFFTTLHILLLITYKISYSSISDLNYTSLNTASILLFGLSYVGYRRTRNYIKSKRENSRKNKGLIIGVDVDGVLANQIDIILPKIRGKYGKHYKYEDIEDWKFKIKDTDIATLIKKYQSYESVISNMIVHEKAVEVINELFKNNIIDIVTARPESCYNETKEWLNKNNIMFDKLMNLKEEGKSLHQMDVLVDDYVGNLIDFLKNSKNGIAILFDQPWNKDRMNLYEEYDTDRLFIVDSWCQISLIMDYIEETHKK